MFGRRFKYAIPWSHHFPDRETKNLGRIYDNQEITTTWTLNEDLTSRQRKAFINEVTRFCRRFGLNVDPNHDHHMTVIGKAITYSRALQTQIDKYEKDGHIYHANSEPLYIPIWWKGKLDTILGLDESPLLHPYCIVYDENEHKNQDRDLDLSRDLEPHATTTFTPLQLATLYDFPTGLRGGGQKIGVIELGGGYRFSDFETYFQMLGIQGTPKVSWVSVNGGLNNPDDPFTSASVEVMLDVEIIIALVPDADTVV